MSPSVPMRVAGRPPRPASGRASAGGVVLAIEIGETMARRLAQEAGRRGFETRFFARLLLEAAWSARCGATGDDALDAAVTGALADGGAASRRAIEADAAAVAAAALEAERRARIAAEARVLAAEAALDAARRELGTARRRTDDLAAERERLVAAGAEREAAWSARVEAAEAAAALADAAAAGARVPAADRRGPSEMVSSASGAARPASFAAVRGIRALASAGDAPAEIAAALDLDVVTVRTVLAETGRSRRDGGAR